MLTVVTFKWRGAEGFRSRYTAEHVRTMRSMVARHYPDPHRFVCVTDDPTGLDDVETVPLWPDHAGVPNPTWPRGPSCYRRLRVFSEEAREWFGDRFVCIDLDAVILDDLRPLWNRPEPCVVYSCAGLGGDVNGSMFMLDAGARSFVWDLFDPIESPRRTHELGYRGSDQAWLTACLRHCSAAWTDADGIASYKSPLPRPASRYLHRKRPPIGAPKARVMFFHGKPDPWEVTDKWVIDNYR